MPDVPPGESEPSPTDRRRSVRIPGGYRYPFGVARERHPDEKPGPPTFGQPKDEVRGTAVRAPTLK